MVNTDKKSSDEILFNKAKTQNTMVKAIAMKFFTSILFKKFLIIFITPFRLFG